MNKLRERLNKKGFTLVELIVVIVIILILAAALIPNVVRYIGQARESRFQADASTYLAELQGYEAENFGKTNKDIVTNDIYTSTNTGGKYKLSGFGTADRKSDGINVSSTTSDYTGVGTVGKRGAGVKTIMVGVNNGSVLAYYYSDGKYYVSWNQSNGWEEVNR